MESEEDMAARKDSIKVSAENKVGHVIIRTLYRWSKAQLIDRVDSLLQ